MAAVCWLRTFDFLTAKSVKMRVWCRAAWWQFSNFVIHSGDRDSVVGKATCYQFDATEFEPPAETGAVIFTTPVQTCPVVHTASCNWGTSTSGLGGKRPGRDVHPITPQYLARMLRTSRAVPPLPFCYCIECYWWTLTFSNLLGQWRQLLQKHRCTSRPHDVISHNPSWVKPALNATWA
jgi:hypothetical protein